MNQRDINLLNKLVSNARAIISNHVAISLGVLIMTGIISDLKYKGIEVNIDLNIFNEVYSLINQYAIGTERLRYNFEYLEKQDKELDRIIALYKKQILSKCFEIVNRYGNRNE